MTTLQEIENLLDIEIGDTRLRNGKKIRDKNKYYYYADQYYIVMLTHGKWMIVEDCKQTRRLLRLHCWYKGYQYPQCSFEKRTKFWHQKFLTYEKGWVCDHINRHRYDNRSDNLRTVTVTKNNRNKTKDKRNTSNKQGLRIRVSKNGNHHYQSRINDNNGNRICKSFSSNVFGHDEAKRLATEWRKQKEEELGYMGD
jgi:hypothetical protein